MDNEQIFSIAGLVAMAGWVALLLAPLRRGPLILAARVIGVILALTYALLMALNWGQGEGGFGSLAEVAQLFASPEILLAGWIHYLAFDLWVGAWAAERAPRDGVPHWALIPCLALTFLFGPIGLLLFLAVRCGFGAVKKTA